MRLREALMALIPQHYKMIIVLSVLQLAKSTQPTRGPRRKKTFESEYLYLSPLNIIIIIINGTSLGNFITQRNLFR